MADARIGVKPWLSYSSFSLLGGGQRSDRPMVLLVNHYSGNLIHSMTDFVLAARVMPIYTRTYNHLDVTASDVPRPHGYGFTTTFDACIFAADLDPATTAVTYKDATGSEYEITWDSGNSKFVMPVGLKKFKLTWNSTDSRYELDDGSHVLYFERNEDMTVAYLTLIREKREYNGDYHALKINRIPDNGYPTVQIEDVQIHYYDKSAPGWDDHTILTPTYVSQTNLIEKWILDDTEESSYKVYVKYTYSSGYLIDVQWFREAQTDLDLNMSTKYQWSNDDPKLLKYIFDSENYVSGTLKTQIHYDSGKVSQIEQPIDGSNEAVTAFAYGLTNGNMIDGDENTLTKVTDPEEHEWLYEIQGQNDYQYDEGKLLRSFDPLYDPSDNKNQVDYDWTDANYQIAKITTGVPGDSGDSSGTVDTKFFYNAEFDLEVVKDQLGFLTFFDFRKDPWGGTPDNDLQDKVHYAYTQKPNRDDLVTEPPGNIDIDLVQEDSGDYYYEDASGTPKQIDLVATEMQYDGDGNLVSSKTPLGFETTFGYDSDTGDLAWVRDPLQTDAGTANNKTDYTYDDIYGAVLTVTTAEPVASATRSTTTNEYNATFTRVTKVILPKSSEHYTLYVYDDRSFLTSVKRRTTVKKATPPPLTVNVDLTVAAYVYDKNGNTLEVHRLKPNLALTEAQYNGDSAINRFKAQEFEYDGMSRMKNSTVYVDLSGGITGYDTTYTYDKRGLTTKVNSPSAANGITSEFTYDDAGRIYQTYDPYDAASKPAYQPFTEPTYDKLGNTLKVEKYDSSNPQAVIRETRYELDVLSRVVKVLRDVTEYDYSQDPPDTQNVTLTSETTYDSAGNVRKQLTPAGYAGLGSTPTKYYTLNEYDDDGRLHKSYQPNSYITGGGGVVTVTYVNDERDYDKNGNVTKHYDFESVSNSKAWYSETKYDNLNRAVNSRVYNSATTTTIIGWNTSDTEFDLNGNVLKTWNKENSGSVYATEYEYDIWDRPVKTTYPQVKDVSNSDVRYIDQRFYYLGGELEKTTDRNGNTPALYTYDQLGRVRITTIPGTYDFQTFYLDRGLVEKTVHPLGAQTLYEYDAAGRTTRVRRENSGQTVTYDTDYTFDDAGQTVQIDFPEGGRQRFVYDEIGRRRITEMLYETSPSDAYIETKAEFTLNGQVSKSYDGRGNASEFEYGLRGELKTSTDPLSRTTTTTYDKNMRTTQVDMPDSRRTAYVYDQAGRTTHVRNYTDTSGGGSYVTTAYAYNNNSQITTTTDQNGGQWPKTFDAMGRNVTTVTPTVSSTNYTNTKYYDGNGNIVKVTDFKSQNTEYTYNARGQRTRIRYKGMGSGGSDVDVDFDWNCCRITSYDDPLGTSASMSYDEFARLTSHTDQQGNALAYEYDGMNRVTKVTDHTSTETEYEYDPAGRLKSLTYDPGGADRVTAYEYDENGNALTATYSNGYKSTYTYDDGNRVTQHTLEDDAGPPNTLEQYDYDYSPGGLPSNTYGYERAETTTGDTYLIAFDRLNRIKQEKMTDSGSNLRYQFDHTYDSAGNRTNLEISGNLYNPRNFGYTFNAMGHLTQVSENTNLNNYVAAVTCDASGNITQTTETWNGLTPLASTLAYDYENRLTQHNVGMLGVTVKHAYDGLGRLIRTDRTIAGPTTTQFEHVRDGLKLVGNIDATNTNTAPTWTNKPGSLRPVESQQVVTNSSAQYINVPDEISPARRTYNPSTSAAGDTEAIAAKGRLVLINGAAPALMNSLAMNPSELFNQRNMTYNENSIALPSDRGTLELSGANLIYEGARVKSWMLGRDLNPGGRGYGDFFPHGMFQIGNLRPQPSMTPTLGYGNSINNLCCPGKNEDPSQPPPPPPCAPGYCHGMEGCNCCASCGGDPADKCCCSCKTAQSMTDPYFAPGCILFGNVGFCPIVPFTYAGDHCKRLKDRTDMAYINEFCGHMRSVAGCYGYYCPWDDPNTGWGCCNEYCASVGFGGGGTGPGGSGGGGGFRGGCTSCGAGGRFSPGGPTQGNAPPNYQYSNSQCARAFRKAAQMVCDCITSLSQQGKNLNTYAATILQCCNKGEPYSVRGHRTCNNTGQIAFVGRHFLFGSKCVYKICCDEFMPMQNIYTFDNGRITLRSSMWCFRQIVAALKMYQCCATNFANPNNPISLTGQDYDAITNLIVNECCSCPAILDIGLDF